MLGRETECVGEMWRMNCAQVAGFNEAITVKDTEIELLRARDSPCLQRESPSHECGTL